MFVFTSCCRFHSFFFITFRFILCTLNAFWNWQITIWAFPIYALDEWRAAAIVFRFFFFFHFYALRERMCIYHLKPIWVYQVKTCTRSVCLNKKKMNKEFGSFLSWWLRFVVFTRRLLREHGMFSQLIRFVHNPKHPFGSTDAESNQFANSLNPTDSKQKTPQQGNELVIKGRCSFGSPENSMLCQLLHYLLIHITDVYFSVALGKAWVRFVCAK